MTQNVYDREEFFQNYSQLPRSVEGLAGAPEWESMREGARTTDWLTRGVIKQYRTIATHLNLLIELGFSLQRIEEWGPSPAQIAAHPEWAVERERPPCLLVSARR